MNKAQAERTSPIAVLAFISTAPGSTLFNRGMSSTQPAKPDSPTLAESIAASRGNVHRLRKKA